MSDRSAVAHAGVALVLLVGLLGTWPVIGLTAPGLVRSAHGTVAERHGDVDHQYKIAGKVRFLFFWASAADVGGARITWRGGDRDQVVSLLIGSEPQRAPREVNEWGYILEDVAGDAATIFGIRTVTDGDSPDEAEARRRQPLGVVEFGVLCSTVSGVDAVSRTSTVSVSRDATYRDVDRILAALE